MSSFIVTRKQLTAILVLCLIAFCAFAPFVSADDTSGFSFGMEGRDDSILDGAHLAKLNSNAKEQFDATQSIAEILRKFGLSKFEHKFIHLFDEADNLFRHLNHAHHFEVVLRVLRAFKQAWIRAMKEEQEVRSKSNSNGIMDVAAMKELVEKVEDHFHRILSSDQEVIESQILPFLAQVHLVFDMIVQGYDQLLQAIPVPISWSFFFMTLPLVERMPTDILEHAMFQELLSAPSKLKEMLHDLLKNLLDGTQGPYVRMGLDLLASLDYSKIQEKFDDL